MSIGGDGGNTRFAFSMIMFAAVVSILLGLFIPIYAPKVIPSDADNDSLSELENQYQQFTGSLPTSEAVWGLKGIYTPYGQDYNGNPSTDYGYTEDGWIYGQRVITYLPSQYSVDTSKSSSYEVRYNSAKGLYYYTTTSENVVDGATTGVNQHKAGDLYGAVVMDAGKKSDIFFSTAGKTEMDGRFYYQFTGLRYAFAPVQEYTAMGSNGNPIEVIPNKSSLSLIWYQYYTQSGIAGQLVISGSDRGVGYITGAQIVSSFNPAVYTSKFTMSFNGVDMILSIRLDPYYITNGMSVEDCYNQGFWSIMVSSKSVEANSHIASDYKFNPTEIFDTMIDLFTFNMDDYGLSGMAATLASLLVVIPLFVALISIGLSNYIVVIMVGIYAAIVALTKLPFFN